MHDAVGFLILAPLAEEREAFLAHLPELRQLPPDPQDVFIYYESALPVEHSSGRRVTYRIIITSPLGFSPHYVVLVGIAGGDPDTARLGDVLIDSQFVDYELQKITKDGAEPCYQTFRAHSGLSPEPMGLDTSYIYKNRRGSPYPAMFPSGEYPAENISGRPTPICSRMKA